MDIIRFNAKDKIKIKPHFFTINMEQSEAMGFYPNDKDECEKSSFKKIVKELFNGLFFRNKVNFAFCIDLWEMFLSEFLFSFYADGYNVVFYTRINITIELTKYKADHFIFHNECYPTYNEGIYFSINKDENETFRNMALFEYFWSLNDYTILIFLKEFIIDNKILHNIAKDQYSKEFLMAEIQIEEDGDLVECVYTQEISATVDRAYNKALMKIKESMSISCSY